MGEIRLAYSTSWNLVSNIAGLDAQNEKVRREVRREVRGVAWRGRGAEPWIECQETNVALLQHLQQRVSKPREEKCKHFPKYQLHLFNCPALHHPPSSIFHLPSSIFHPPSPEPRPQTSELLSPTKWLKQAPLQMQRQLSLKLDMSSTAAVHPSGPLTFRTDISFPVCSLPPEVYN